MADSSYNNMTVEHLGAEATEEDLEEFRSACARYQARTGCSDLEATDAIWGDGDFGPRVAEELRR